MSSLVLGATLALLVGVAGDALEDYWPHLPGASWTYDRIDIEWKPQAIERRTTVRFEIGAPTTVGSVVAQPLDVTVDGLPAERNGAFTAQLARARPDLGRRLRGAAAGAPSGLVLLDAALVRIAADEIAAYRESPPMRSWIYLTPDLAPGATFHLQLVPDLADSVFLDGRVVGPTDISTPAGGFDAALRVAYVIDYGWAAVFEDTVQVGRVRSRTRGEMFWARGVGPVLVRETFRPYDEVEGTPPPAPLDSTFAELRLESYVLDPTSVVPTSWSAIKRRYAGTP